MMPNLDLTYFLPNTAHIHGMANPPYADGTPESYFTSDGRHGADYYTLNPNDPPNRSTFRIINYQEEATLFYHDHSIGMTRLNVYAGLAGFFLVEDPQSYLSKSFDRNHDLLLAMADRSFYTNGSLYYPY